MKRRGEAGYILAGALAAILAMSLVAAALVAASLQEVRRVAAAERAAADDAALDAAITLAAAELQREPQVRSLALDGAQTVSVAGRDIIVTAGWESEKLDVNLAAPGVVDAALAAVGMSAGDRAEVRRRLEARDGNTSLVDALLTDVAAPECAQAVLTTFGGRSDWTEGGAGETIALGLPAPGSRIWIDAAIDGADGRGRRAVFLMTGDPTAPVRVLDWRSTRGHDGEACDAG